MESPPDNPFQSPATESSRRNRIRFPKRIFLAQACGLVLTSMMLTESYTFAARDLPWPTILNWGAAITLIAIACMSIPNQMTATFPRIYFELIGCLFLMSGVIAFGVDPAAHYSFFFLSGALLCMVVVIVMYQKPTQAYHAPRR